MLLNQAGIECVKDENGFEYYKYNRRDTNKYNYTSRLKKLYDIGLADDMQEARETGWVYTDTTTNQQVAIELTDDLVEVAQQAAIWYYTNYKNENSGYDDIVFDIFGSDDTPESLNLSCNGTDLEEETPHGLDGEIKIGKYKKEQATILAWYLIDAAKDYADSVKDKYWYSDKSNNSLTEEAITYWVKRKIWNSK